MLVRSYSKIKVILLPTCNPGKFDELQKTFDKFPPVNHQPSEILFTKRRLDPIIIDEMDETRRFEKAVAEYKKNYASKHTHVKGEEKVDNGKYI